MKPAFDIRAKLQEAMTLHQRGDVVRAEAMYREVLAVNPNEPNAWHLLGCIAWKREDLAQGEEYVRKAIKLHPKAPAYYKNLAGILREKGDAADAIAQYEKALKLAPTDEDTRKELAMALHRHARKCAENKQWDEAEATYRRTLELEPDNIPTLNNLAGIVMHRNSRAAARKIYDDAIKIAPENLLLKYNRAICELTQGDLPAGWKDLEASEPHWRPMQDKRQNLPWLQRPIWDGSDLRGKRVLVWGDQGIGDEIVYLSMVPDFIARGADVTVECMDRLVPIVARSFPEVRVVARQDPPLIGGDFDFHAPGMWLGRHLRPDMNAFPKRHSFLKADSDKTAKLRKRYEAYGKKRIVGLSWYTLSTVWGQNRSQTLDAMLKDLPLADSLIIDMQYGETAEAWAEAKKRFPELTYLHDDEVDQFKDMDMFAAQVAACDVIYTISNTTSHVAGSLGVPGIILMSDIGLTWYWFEKGEECPWYPSLKLLRPSQEKRLQDAAAMIAADKAWGEAQTHYTIGVDLWRQDKWDEAKAEWQKALAANPGHVQALDALGELLVNLGEGGAARRVLDQALALEPARFSAQFNRGILSLSEGKLAEGWDDVLRTAPQWVGGSDNRSNLPWLKIPLWDGKDAKGKSILVWGDPGVGDEVLFASMLPDLAARGVKATLECSERLMPLFARSLPGIELLPCKQAPEARKFDAQVPSFLLGVFFRREWNAFPKQAFLKADEGRVAAFRKAYEAFRKKRIIGISWHTRTQHWGGYRCIPLHDLAKQLPQDNLYIDLQYGDTADERAQVAKAFPDFELHHDQSVDALKDLDAFAAQVKACDGVITISNSTPHIAGALGVPTAALLPKAGVTWYWFKGERECPWYPNLRLIRGDEPEPIAKAIDFILGDRQ